MAASLSVSSTVYYKEVMDIINKTKASPKELMTQKWVDIMIQRITAAELIVAKDGYSSLHESIKTTLRTYLVNIKNGKQTLVLKPVPGKEHRSKTIVPLEDSYDVVQKAHHLTNHGTSKDMEIWLVSNNYVLNSLCLEVYCKLCAKCLSGNMPTPSEQDIIEQSIAVQTITDDLMTDDLPKETDTAAAEKLSDRPVDINICDEDSFDHVCSVDILDISKNRDHIYQFLLIYEDRKTNFIQLRPLTSNSETEIAMELIKIIMDFGPPECIVVDAENKIVFAYVLEKVKVLATSDIAIALHKTENKLIQKVAKKIILWMKENDCKNWGTGCHVVQWNLNNKSDIFGVSPFSRVFGYKYTGFGYESKFVSPDPVVDNLDSDDSTVLIADDDGDADDNLDQAVKPAFQNETSDKAFIVTMTENVIKTETTDAELLYMENLNVELSKIQYDSSDEDE